MQQKQIVPFNALNLVRRHVLHSHALLAVELLFRLMIPDICSVFPYLFSFHSSPFIYFFTEGKSKIQFAGYFNIKALY